MFFPSNRWWSNSTRQHGSWCVYLICLLYLSASANALYRWPFGGREEEKLLRDCFLVRPGSVLYGWGTIHAKYCI